MRALILLISALALAALWWWLSGDGAPPEPEASDIIRAETLRPIDPELAAIYERSCMACHALVEAQAPLTGFAPAWAKREKERGAHGLLLSARNGFGNMPAMGLCLDCSDDQLTALIAFMSGEGQQ